MTLAPLRFAPRNNTEQLLASPSAPWQSGMSPDQVPERFMTATLIPIAVTDGMGASGSRSAARALTAKAEFSVVRGSCPMDIHSADESLAPVHRGQTNRGDQT
ncbi:uncharacterized protein CPUR_05650 [Claviceps purpurea 20.1]|uniref:Uncharacterized protein n=1 Tax=Claviceps purpurea (strain 20.1) TaxID=1111077 RepID=M1W8C9_CLAP2|nr:hypothetical protein E4U26_001110 [Claviceps purpurea]CCE31795.1 uncharacterized protein CPUR_05650 [Claviceps purpurea 20.1]